MTSRHCSRLVFASCGHSNDRRSDDDEFTPHRVPEDDSPAAAHPCAADKAQVPHLSRGLIAGRVGNLAAMLPQSGFPWIQPRINPPASLGLFSSGSVILAACCVELRHSGAQWELRRFATTSTPARRHSENRPRPASPLPAFPQNLTPPLPHFCHNLSKIKGLDRKNTFRPSKTKNLRRRPPAHYWPRPRSPLG
jgi:hypothetical protein